MNLYVIGWNHRTIPIKLQECLAFRDEHFPHVLNTLNRRGWEIVILNTCSRVELCLGRFDDSRRSPAQNPFGLEQAADMLAELHGLSALEIHPYLYSHRQEDAVRHLFRVSAGLDSIIIGDKQNIAQIKNSYEWSRRHAFTGPLLDHLFSHALRVARRVRTETLIAQGPVSIYGAALGIIREVFDHFRDKVALVIGDGKMADLALRCLRKLHPGHIWVTNMSFTKAQIIARCCGGDAFPLEKLDDLLAGADIVLSATDALEVIVTSQRWARLWAKHSGPVVILDLSEVRDFDPCIARYDQTFLFNIDDLKRIREKTLAQRLKHMPAAEAIVEQEFHCFQREWVRQRKDSAIKHLTKRFDAERQEIIRYLSSRLLSKLTKTEFRHIEESLHILQSQLLNGPIGALAEETHAEPAGHTLLGALCRLFRLEEQVSKKAGFV